MQNIGIPQIKPRTDERTDERTEESRASAPTPPGDAPRGRGRRRGAPYARAGAKEFDAPFGTGWRPYPPHCNFVGLRDVW